MRYRNIKIICLALIFSVMLVPLQLRANELQVDPGTILIQNVPLGKVCTLKELTGREFTIHNKDKITHTYYLSTHQPSKTGDGKWASYRYKEIPEPKWVSFEKKEITVEANKKKKVNLYINIPKKEENYNQRWEVTIEVKSKQIPGNIFVLAVYPRFQIETEEKK